MESSEATITSRCLCKRHSFSVSVARNSLPLAATCCHCDSCRHLTGALYYANTKWPNGKEDLSALKKYSFSASIDVFSCGICSTPMFTVGPQEAGSPCVITGTLDNTPKLVEYTKHICVGDTTDGGASMWLRHKPNNAGLIKRYMRREEQADRKQDEELSYDWPSITKPLEGDQLPVPDRTPIQCHCGGVDLVLRSGRDYQQQQIAPRDLPFFVDPTSYKYLGITDACDSCRLMIGCDLLCWTFAELNHIEFPTNISPGIEGFPPSVPALRESVDTKSPGIGTLAYYNSSPDVERYFCSRCSASVFYAVHDRPNMVDVAVGLLRHPDGARAEGLLSWDFERIGGGDDVKGGWRQELRQSALIEWSKWSAQCGYTCWRSELRKRRTQRG